MYCNLLNVCLIHFQINDMYCIYIYSPFHNSLPLFIIKVYTVGFITIYLVISVLQYGATKGAEDPDILAESPPVKAALEALQRIVSVRYPRY